MSHNLTPDYLASLVPPSFESSTSYRLRDASNIRHATTRTQLYYKSFLPSSIRSLNEISPYIRDSNSVQSFRYQLNKNISRPLKYYYIGDRFIQIQHTRVRTNCSILNHHLFSRNIIDNLYCTCGAIETTKQFS